MSSCTKKSTTFDENCSVINFTRLTTCNKEVDNWDTKLRFYFFFNLIAVSFGRFFPLLLWCMYPRTLLPVVHLRWTSKVLLRLEYLNEKKELAYLSESESHVRTHGQVLFNMFYLRYVYAWRYVDVLSSSNPQKTISEPQTRIKPTIFWWPVRRSNHRATDTQIAT